MGEAKRRGTFEQRKAEAIQRNKVEAARREIERQRRNQRLLDPERPRGRVALKARRPGLSSGLSLAMAIAMAGVHHSE